MDLLAKAGIREGIIESAVEKLCRNEDPNKRLALTLARGKEVKNGVDSHFDPAYNADAKPGSIRKDGSIEFRDRNIIIGVKENDLLGEFFPATKGENGTNVLGAEVEARDGEPAEFSAGEGVRVEEEQGGSENSEGSLRKFYATCDGSVQRTDG